MTKTADVKVTYKQLSILQHALGRDQYGRRPPRTREDYRNRFVTSCKGTDGEECLALVALGLMSDEGEEEAADPMTWFRVTELGVKVVNEQSPKPPGTKRKRIAEDRYSRYLEVSDAYDLTFHEFLTLRFYEVESDIDAQAALRRLRELRALKRSRGYVY